MSGILGLDIGGSSVKAWLSTDDPSQGRLATVALPLVSSPDKGLVEFDPERWWALICDAMKRCMEVSDRPEIGGVVISSIRQAFLLCDDSGEIGAGIHNADRRGADGLGRLGDVICRDDIYDLTGHWSAPQMPLPKLVAIRDNEPARWERVSRLMFVQDWVAWRMTGVWKNERTLATSSQLCEIQSGEWATGLLASLGLRDEILGEIIEAGDIVGVSVSPELPDLLGVPVVAGGGDAHFLAFGARSSTESEIVAVAGSTTPIQTISECVPKDEHRRPWISAGLTAGSFAVEMNAGYTGVALDWLCGSLALPRSELVKRAWIESEPGSRGVVALTASPSWDRDSWLGPIPFSFARLDMGHRPVDLVRAVFEAHAYAIRANVEALDSIVESSAPDLVLTGGWAQEYQFVQLLADVTGRRVRAVDSLSASIGVSTFLAGRCIGGVMPSAVPFRICEPIESPSAYADRYVDYCRFYRHAIVRDPIRTG